jgi:hypothetical protein
LFREDLSKARNFSNEGCGSVLHFMLFAMRI